MVIASHIFEPREGKCCGKGKEESMMRSRDG